MNEEMDSLAAACIPKRDLIHGAYYQGRCRNATVARWDGFKQRFYHWRTKFGSTYIEAIRHPEDEQVFDVFYPLKELPPSEYTIRTIPLEEPSATPTKEEKQQ